MTFEELGLMPWQVDALQKQKITTPTEIQAKAFPLLTEKKDAYICSETGTGKTLSYLLPLTYSIDTSSKNLQTIILTPTHELAIQVRDQITLLKQGTDAPPIKTQVVIGSTSTKRQIEKLKEKPHVIIGSYGRIFDLIQQKKLKAHAVNTIIIDEVDRLLFGESIFPIKRIIKATTKKPHMVFASASIKPESHELAKELSSDLIDIQAESDSKAPEGIQHFYLQSQDLKKPETLRKLLYALDPDRALIFVHRNKDTEEIAELLQERKVSIFPLNSDMDKFTRQKTLDRYKKGRIKVLICSDVAARGLDIKDVSHVINYDAPQQSNDYLHRVGRTGRAGASGVAVSIMNPIECKLATKYAKQLNISISEITLNEGNVVLPE